MERTGLPMSTSPAFAVRRADIADIVLLARHRAWMFRDMGDLPAHLEGPLERATAAYLREAMPRREYVAWVAEGGADPATAIGGAGVQLRPILPRPRPIRDPDGLELGPEALVLNVYVEHARGIRRIVLHASDEGRRLYERLGFVRTSEMRFEPA